MAKHVLITGASRGIGAATARVFAAEGWNVALNYCRSRDQALALAAELSAGGVEAVALEGDVSDPDQASALWGPWMPWSAVPGSPCPSSCSPTPPTSSGGG